MEQVLENGNSASIMAPILVKRMEDKTYDFKRYMHENWDK